MTEPTPPPAPAPGQASPPPPPAQQAAPQNQPPTPASPTPPANPPPAGTPPASATPPAVVQPNAELLALKAERDRLAQSHAEATRKITQQGQQLAQLVGAQPQQPQADPIAPIIADLIADGMHPDDAKVMAKGIHRATAPYRQQLQQQQQSIQATSMVGEVMREAWTEMPQLFAFNPSIGQRVEQVMRHNAVTGQGPVDKNFAIAMAKIEWADAQFAAQAGQTPPPQQQQQPVYQQPPSFQSMYAPNAGFQQPTPSSPAAPVRTPEQQAWDAEIKQTFKTDKRTA